ncbi:recombinase family protein [Paenibacillus pinisoli]|uniref:Recombinase family protein n=1 Tax=Paenibacillus pinisoli TaxID=1276110 RepID=A0A3A6PGK8_9BACL|nr:recombinase family protein [Paenibacillus pinisoli]RJX40922.1 recombinase family protein [Paenibacillus pinisoli]
MDIGYARVSDKDQNPERQLLKFRELGIDERYIFIDKLTGADFDRPQYQAMRLLLRAGDLLYLDALDRLGRDYDGIIFEWKYITREIGADIVCLDNEILFDSRKFRAMADFGKVLEDQFLSLLAYVAEQERKKSKQRQREGIAVAKAEGIVFGRPKFQIDEKFIRIYSEWRSERITAVTAYKTLGVSAATFYRRVKELKQSDYSTVKCKTQK